MNAATLRDIYSSAPPILRYSAAIGAWLVLYLLLPGLALLALAAWGLWFFKGYQRLLVLFVVAAFTVYEIFGVQSLGTTRHRMTFEIGANGEVKSASSIIELEYFWASSTTGNSTIARRRRGVAAVVDLGPTGMLVAALAPDFSEWRRRRDQFGLSCGEPAGTREMFDAAFGLDYRSAWNISLQKEFVAKVQKLPEGKRKLGDDHLPAFIWFPNGGSYRQAQQLCPEEFSRVIGTDVKLRTVTIEIAPNAPVLTRLDLQAPWLDEMRNDRKNGSRSGNDPYHPYLPHQIESCQVTPENSRCYEWAE
jgi:hypothetical protein